MAVVESNFVTKLEEIAKFSEQSIIGYDLCPDLSLQKKSWLSFFNYYNLATSFYQVSVFFQVLDKLQTEILRDDYACLGNVKLREILPKAFKNLCVLAGRNEELIKKIESIKIHCFSYYPFRYPRADGLPVIDKSLSQGDIEKAFRHLCDDVGLKDRSLTISQKIELYNRVLNYGVYVKDVDERLSKNLREKISHFLMELFLQPFLLPEAKTFIHNALLLKESPNKQYSSRDFVRFLEREIREITDNRKHHDCYKRLDRLHQISIVYRKFKAFVYAKGESKRTLKHCSFMSLFSSALFSFIESLPRLNQNFETRKKLREVFIRTTKKGALSYFKYLIDRLYIIARASNKSFPFDPFHQAAFLVENEGFLKVSEDWADVFKTLECSIDYFLCRAFTNYCHNTCDLKKYAYYSTFNRDPSVTQYTEYLVSEALKEEGSDVLIEKICRLKDEAASPVLAILKKGTFPIVRIVALLNIAMIASNSQIIELCRKKLASHFCEFLKGKQSLPNSLKISEQEYIKIIEAMVIEPVIAGNKESRNPICYSLDITKKDFLTLNILNHLLQKIPQLNLINFPCTGKSKFCDIVILDGKGQFLFFNSAVLMRSSLYFQQMFRRGFSESSVFRERGQAKLLIEMDEENFSILYKFSSLMLEPSMEPSDESVYRIDPAHYLLELNFAQYFRMDAIYKILKPIYTRLVKEVNFDSVVLRPLTPKGMTLFWQLDPSNSRKKNKKQLKLPFD